MRHSANAPSDMKHAAGADENRSNPLPEIDTRALLGERREATLIHAGARYRLRVTSNNRLILTK